MASTIDFRLQRWPINPNLHGFKKRPGLAPWCLSLISKWEWTRINEWLSIHGYCGHLTKFTRLTELDLLYGEVVGTESILWIEPHWQASCLDYIDSLPKRTYTVALDEPYTRRQASKLFSGNYEIFTGYNYVFGSFAEEQDAFMATIGWKT